MTKITLSLLSILLFISLFSSATLAKAISDIELIGGGARFMSLGRTGVADADDASSVFINPAGLGFASDWGITSMSTKILNQVNYIVLGADYPTDWGTFGVGLINATSPAGYYTTDEASLSGAPAINFSDSVLIISYANEVSHLMQKVPKTMGKLSLGGSLKIFQKSFIGGGASGANGLGMDIDFGAIFRPSRYFSLGFNLTNVLPNSLAGDVNWASKQSEYIPTTIKLGASLMPIDNLTLLGDFYYTAKPNEPMTFHVGGEYTYMDIFSARAGVNQQAASEGTNSIIAANYFTLGIGVNYQGFAFDYAYCPDINFDTNTTHYFSLSYVFTPLGELKKKEEDKNIDLELQKDLEKLQNLDNPPVNKNPK